MKKRMLALVAIAALSFCAGSLLAHHSTDVYFDLTTTYLLRGIISGVSWANPHTYAFMNVTTCKADNWAVELPSPAALTRAGFRRDTLKNGMAISVYASPAKFPSTSPLREVEDAWKSKHLVLGGCMTLPDGKKIEYDNGPRCTRPKQDVVIGIEPK